jgi:hypothetical protein
MAGMSGPEVRRRGCGCLECLVPGAARGAADVWVSGCLDRGRRAGLRMSGVGPARRPAAAGDGLSGRGSRAARIVRLSVVMQVPAVPGVADLRRRRVWLSHFSMLISVKLCHVSQFLGLT